MLGNIRKMTRNIKKIWEMLMGCQGTLKNVREMIWVV
jgi:hypothetical protein